MATINDIARKTGLSVGTVSRYLNGESLKEQNKLLIEAAIEELGYRHNALARSIRTGKSMTIAVIIPVLSNMFSMRIIEAIERTVEGKGYSVLIAGCEGNPQKMYEKLELMKRRMVDGFVIMTNPDCKASQIKRITANVPVIIIDRYPDEPLFDTVTINNEELVYNKIKELLQRGVRKIGFIEGPKGFSTASQRKQGYLKAMNEAGANTEYIVQCPTYSVEDGIRAMEELSKFDLEAVFASNYELSVGALLASKSSNVKIIGVDKIELADKLSDIYEYIPQPIEAIGEKAANLLLERIEKGDGPVRDLVIRG